MDGQEQRIQSKLYQPNTQKHNDITYSVHHKLQLFPTNFFYDTAHNSFYNVLTPPFSVNHSENTAP